MGAFEDYLKKNNKSGNQSPAGSGSSSNFGRYLDERGLAGQGNTSKAKTVAENETYKDEVKKLEMEQARRKRDEAAKQRKNYSGRGSWLMYADPTIATAMNTLASADADVEFQKYDAEYNRLRNELYQLENQSKLKALETDSAAAEQYAAGLTARSDKDKLLHSYLPMSGLNADQVTFGYQNYAAQLQQMHDREELQKKYNAYEPIGIAARINASERQAASKLDESGYNFDRIADYERRLADQAAREKEREQNLKYANNSPYLSSLTTVPVALLQGADYLNLAGQTIANDFRGDDDYRPIDTSRMHATNYVMDVRGQVGQNIEENTDWVIGNQNVARFLYDTGMSLGDSTIAIIATGGVGATYLLGGSAASQTAIRTLQKGGSDEQAMLTGLTAGAAEAIFERAGIENLLRAKNVTSVKRLLRETLRQSEIEATEEILTEISNILTDSIIMGQGSDFAQSVSYYMSEQGGNMTEEEAKKQALLDCISQVAWAGAGGFISGGVMGGTTSSVNLMGNVAAADMRYGQDPEQLISPILTYDPQNRLALETRKKVEAGEKVGGYQLSKLSEQYATLLERAEQAKEESNKKGKKTIEDVARGYGRQSEAVKGIYLPDQDVEKFEKAFKAAHTFGQKGVTLDYAMSDESTQFLTEKQRELAYNTGRESANAVKVPENVGDYNVSSEGKTLYKVTDGDGNTTFEVAELGSVTDVSGSKMVIDVGNGVEVEASDISFSSVGEAMLYQTVTTVANTADEANALIGGYAASGLSHEQYAAGIRNAYDAGRFNEPQNAVMNQHSIKNLPADVATAAYNAGRNFANEETANAEAAVRAKIPEGVKARKRGKVQFMQGTSRHDFRKHIQQSGKKLNTKQEAAIQMAEMLSQMTGVNFIVYESYRNEKGKLVYSDRNGIERSAPNGFYTDGTGDIYIDLNAGNSSEGLMLYTMGHELTHFIKAWSPTKYRVLATALMDEYSKTEGKSVNQLLEEQQLKAKSHNRTISKETAYDELVADSMEQILESGRVVEIMADIKKQDRTLWNRIKKWFKDFADKLKAIKAAYEGAKPDSAEAQIVASIDGALERLEPIFAEALAEAGDNYQMSLKLGEESYAYNAKGEPVAHATADGSVQLSLRTYEDGGRETYREYLAKQVKANKLTKEEMNELLDGIDEIYRVCKDFKDQYAPFSAWSDAEVVRDTYGKPVFSVVTPNGEYKMNLDFSLVCKKRRTLDAVFNEMAQRGIIDDFELGQKSVVKINEIIRKHQFETACALCFVDAKRFRQASMADQFVRLYNELVKSLVPADQIGEIGFFNFAGNQMMKEKPNGIHTWDSSKLDFTHINKVMKEYGTGTVEYKAAQYIKSSPEARQLVQRGDFMSSGGFDAVKVNNKKILSLYNSKKGTGGPKAAFGDVQYLNEVISKARWWTPAKAYAVGGIRVQSFSDYIPRMVFDYVQMIYDLAATRLPAHAYTKETLFAKQFGLTGIKINLSLIPAVAKDGVAPGLDANGNYVWAGESFDYNAAIELQNADGYTENCGTICVGVSNQHILKLLSDPNIRMVIPYHKSGLNPIVAHMNRVDAFEDYTDKQNTRYRNADGTPGSKLEAKHNKFDFNAQLRKLGDPRATAEAYKQWCADNNYVPKFDEFAWHPDYYKLLIDFTVYDRDGNYVPQREVRANFPKSDSAFGSMKKLIKSGLEEDAIIEGRRNSELSGIVDEIERTLPKTEAEIAEDEVEQADHDVEADLMATKNTAEDDGVMYSERDENKKITVSMTDAERTAILKSKVIKAAKYEGQADESILREQADLESGKIGLVKSALVRIGEEFDVFTDYEVSDVEVKFQLSRGNLKESVSKDVSGVQLAKLLPVLKPAVENAIGIECHENRYYYDNDTVMFENLLGGYIDGNDFVPVRFGLKHRRNGNVVLYVIVDQQKIDNQKIKAEVVNATGTQSVQPEASRSAYMYSVSTIIPFVNSKDLLRYLPDDMLSTDQKTTKWEAIADTIVRTNNKNDKKYIEYIRNGNLDSAQKMVINAARAAGYTVEAWHGTRSEEKFTVFRTNPKNGNYGSHFTTNNPEGDEYNPANMLGGKGMYHVYLKADNPYETMDMYADDRYWQATAIDELAAEIGTPRAKEIQQELREEYPLDSDDYGADYRDSEEGLIRNPAEDERLEGFMRELLEAGGYDSLAYQNEHEGQYGEEYDYVILNPEQIKSADAITYDNNGNVIPLSQRFNAENPDIRYSERDAKLSDQEVLRRAADELDADKLSATERNSLAAFHAKLDEIDELEQQIEQAREAEDTKRVRKLNKELRAAKNEALEIQNSDTMRQILQKARGIVEKNERTRLRKALREEEQARHDKMVEKYEESRAKAVNSRQKTVIKNQFKRKVSELEKLLEHGNKKHNIKHEMQPFVEKAIAAAKLLMTDSVTDEEILRNGIGTEITPVEAKYVEEAKALLDQIDDIQQEIDELKNAEATPAIVEQIESLMEEIEPLRNQMNYRIRHYLTDVMIRERARLNAVEVNSAIDAMIDAYGQLQGMGGYLANVYDPYITNKLTYLKGSFNGVKVSDMTSDQLEELADAFTMIIHNVRKANKAFKLSRNVSISELAEEVKTQLGALKQKGKLTAKALEISNTFFWNNEKPVYAFSRIGSDTLTELFNNLRSAEDVWARDVGDADVFRREVEKRFNFNDWKLDQMFTFTSATGKQFEISLGQMMSLYAYSKREQAAKHIQKGGIVIDLEGEVVKKNKFGIPIKYKNNDANAHSINEETMQEIIGNLTDDQKAYVDEMQEYLSSTMGEKGNEVSMQLYGVKLFKEKFYFPLRSSALHMAREEDQNAVRIKSYGFTNALVENAANPIILSDFMDVWAGHVNEMSMYHAFVLPMDDFNKVFNWHSKYISENDAESVKAALVAAHGDAARMYVEQFISDLNGGAVTDSRETLGKALISKFKKAAVFASLSVIIQQPTSVFRSFAVIDPKYFIGEKIDGRNHAETWKEIKKYAPVAVIKEMGYFDTNMGRTAKDFLQSVEYEGGLEKAEAFFKDGDFRDEVFSRMPAYADEMAWGWIWNAVKREQALANPTIATSSAEFLEICGKRFTEIITRTQVYDSVMSRSANMRSKGSLMNMATAFMAEPTTTINMMEDAVRKYMNGDKASGARVAAATLGSIVVNALVVSIVYAMRDDDDDETFAEKYASAAVSALMSGVNPLTYFPFVKDIWSIMQGYDVERADMSLISDLANAMKKAYALSNKDISSMSEEELDEYHKQVRDAWWNVADYTAAMFGLPVKNIRRDVNAVRTAINTLSIDQETTMSSLKDVVEETIRSDLPILGWAGGKTKQDKLYEAIINGDDVYAERIRSTYKDENAYRSAVRKALRENDPRVHEAAVAYMNEDYITYKSIYDSIKKEGNFTENDIVAALKSEINALTPDDLAAGTSAEKVKALFTTENFVSSAMNGRTGEAATIKSNIVSVAVANGKTQEEAEKSFCSSVNSEVRDMLKNGAISDSKAYDLFTQYGGMEPSDAQDEIYLQEFKREHDGVDDITRAAVIDYYDYAEPAGIDAKTFYSAWKTYNNTPADYTASGSTIRNSKTKKMMPYINSLPLTAEQKTALALCWWSPSTVRRYKLW